MGYARRDPAYLQPAEVFLDFSGEDIRRRLFITEGADGQQLCLRPEFTIPLSLEYLKTADTALPADLFASGPVFRQRPGETGEFVQIGVERFGHAEEDVADAETLALALDLLKTAGIAAPRARIGDVALIHRVLDGLSVSPAARRRLLKALAAGRPMDGVVSAADAPTQLFSGMLKLLEGADPKDAKALVKDMLAIGGIARVGGRSSEAIAERFLRRAGGESAALTPEQAARLKPFLAIAGEPDQALEALRHFAREERISLDAPLRLFESRIGFLASHGVDLSTLTFDAGFVRSLDYYTGFIFEVPSVTPGKPVIGGGRYDSLMRRLGSQNDIPAIGFALWLERLEGLA